MEKIFLPFFNKIIRTALIINTYLLHFLSSAFPLFHFFYFHFTKKL